MKAKKIITIALAATMALTAAVSASAQTLTDQSPSGRTEVTANIEGADVPGDVTYEITIPDVVTFGTLHQPASDEQDDFVYADYTVTADKITGLEADQQVFVYVRDQNATVDGDHEFWIANKSDSSKKFKYDVFDVREIGQNTDSINQNNMSSAAGYFLEGFTEEGQAVNGTLRLNQLQLYGQNIADLVGEYSGYMVFFSTIESV